MSSEYPMTRAQEQEMRGWARDAWSYSHATVETVTIVLGSFVFQGGRLSDTVSYSTRRQIAQEEQPSR